MSDCNAFFSTSRFNTFIDSRYDARGAIRGDVLSRETFSPFSSVDTWYAARDYPYLTKYDPITFVGQPHAAYQINLGFRGTAGLENWNASGAEFNISAGSLPPGLTLTPGPFDGSINLSGTPTTTGNFPFTIMAENSEGFAEREFPFVVLDAISVVESADILSGLLAYAGESGTWDGILIPFGMTNGNANYYANIAPDAGSSRFAIILLLDFPSGSNRMAIHDATFFGDPIIRLWDKAGATTTPTPPTGTYTGGPATPFPENITLVTA